MTLDAHEFIRRFLLHVLPDGFQRIRHYGLLGNRGRQAKLARCRQLLDAPPPPLPVLAPLANPHDRYQALTGRSLHVCPACTAGAMRRVEILPATVGRNPRPVGPTRHDAAPQPPTVIVRRTPAQPRLVRRAGLAAVETAQIPIWATKTDAMPSPTAVSTPKSLPLPAAAMPETPHQPIDDRLAVPTLKQSP